LLFLLSFRRKGFHALLGIGAPLGASEIDLGIGDLGSTGFAPSADFVLEKLDLLPALWTGDVEYIPRLPIPDVLPRAFHLGLLLCI
jgi:hypothetical protein